jgi:hypothetical protein
VSHTPGPWFVEHTDDDYYMNMTVISTVDSGEEHTGDFHTDGVVAIVWHQSHPMVMRDSLDMADSNARLIASAPDLLAACELVISDTAIVNDNGKYATVQISSGVLDEVRAALKKAKGNQ